MKEAEPATLRVGQLWVTGRRPPAGAFLITKLYYRDYPDGAPALRVKGVVVHGDLLDDNGDADIGSNDIDARSFAKMYPHLKFDIPPAPEPEDK